MCAHGRGVPFKQTHIAADACRAEVRHRPISPPPFNCRLVSKHGCLLKHFVLVRPQVGRHLLAQLNYQSAVLLTPNMKVRLLPRAPFQTRNRSADRGTAVRRVNSWGFCSVLRVPNSAFDLVDGWQSSNAPVLKTEWGASPRGCNSFTIRHFPHSCSCGRKSAATQNEPKVNL